MDIDQKILFIRYEDLCTDPQVQLDRFYAFLGLESHRHDFAHVQQLTQEDDSVYGIFGNHTIRPKVQPQPSKAQETFGPLLCDFIAQRYQWFYDRFATGA